ncbi:MAG: GNAT family N-acetyltransferase [Thermomicrobia bacterium]|nr:GNAT family N-acetyltransferase [Thermomicrobia bacterium]
MPCGRDDRCIGMVGVDGIDYLHRTAETFSALGPAEFRNQGYGTEAKHLLLEYCFDHLHLHALRSSVFAANTRSAAALIKQGYREAGRLKWADVKGGIYQDDLLFDVMRDEWLAARDAWRAKRAAGGR